MTFAGLGWVILGLSALGSVPLRTLLMVLAVFAVLLVSTLILQRTLRDFPASPPAPTVQKVFRQAVAFEVILIAAGLVVFGLWLHQPEFIMPVAALAAGLHFFPLARVLRRPLYYVTGGALCAIAVGVPLFIPRQIGLGNISGWLFMTGLSGGMIL